MSRPSQRNLTISAHPLSGLFFSRVFARLRIRNCDYAVLRSVVATMTVSEYFLLKQFSRNVDHAILTALLNALYNGRRRLTESEIQFMEDEKSTKEMKPDNTPEVN